MKASQAPTMPRNSQVANSIKVMNSLPFDSDALRKNPAVAADIVRKTAAERETLTALSRALQHRQIASCYNVARHLQKSEPAWSYYCRSFHTKNTDQTPKNILRTVFLDYAGRDDRGQKLASRYFRALIDDLLVDTPAESVAERLSSGGVAGLLGARSSVGTPKAIKGTQRPTRPVEITKQGIYEACLRRGFTQRISLKCVDSGNWRYVVTVERFKALQLPPFELRPSKRRGETPNTARSLPRSL